MCLVIILRAIDNTNTSVDVAEIYQGSYIGKCVSIPTVGSGGGITNTCIFPSLKPNVPIQVYFRSYVYYRMLWRMEDCPNPAQNALSKMCSFQSGANSTVAITASFSDRPSVITSVQGNPQGGPDGTIYSLSGTYPPIECRGTAISPINQQYGSGVCKGYFMSRKVVRLSGKDPTNNRTFWDWDTCPFMTGPYCVLTPVGLMGEPTGYNVFVFWHFNSSG